MSKKEKKTNAMRLLDQKKVAYEMLSYETEDGQIDGLSVAKKIGEDENLVYKTLVTVGQSKAYYVFVIPVQYELSLKKAAKSVGEKKVEMIKVSDINKVTGYIRGGCSPLGMKKQFMTVVDVRAEEEDLIIFSAGKIGQQIKMSPKNLVDLIQGKFGEITI